MNSRRIYELKQAIKELCPDFDFDKAKADAERWNYIWHLENIYFELERTNGRNTG